MQQQENFRWSNRVSKRTKQPRDFFRRGGLLEMTNEAGIDQPFALEQRNLRELGSFTEEKLLHLFFHHLHRIRVERIQTVFVHDHLGMFDPHFPRLFGDVFVNAFAQIAFPGNPIKPLHFFSKFYALHHSRSRFRRAGNARWTAVTA